MGLMDSFAKYLADRVPLDSFPQWFQIEVTRQIQEMAHRFSKENIAKVVEEFMESPKFQNLLARTVSMTVQRTLKDYERVVVVEEEKFGSFVEKHKIRGPFETLIFDSEYYRGEGKAYGNAIRKLQKSAAERGYNLVELVNSQTTSYKNEYGEIQYVCAVTGHCYILEQLIDESLIEKGE